jgi:pilus assembly protein FimV
MAVNRDKILREAEKLVQKGKIDQAIREYEKLLKANPGDANTINRIGDLYGRAGEIDKAVELYERIARTFQRDGFIPKAIAILKKINRLVPQRLEIFEQLADLYIQQGLVVEAINQYRILADWYLRSEDVPKAIEAYTRLSQLDPSNHMAHLKLADLLLQKGESDGALKVYDRLGRMLLERGKLDEAERLYRHVLEQGPPSGGFLAPLAEAMLNDGKAAAASEIVTAGLDLSPDDEGLKLLEVRALLGSGGPSQAMAAAEKILAEQPDNTRVRLLVGSSLLEHGEAAKAHELMVPALEKLLAEGSFAVVQEAIQSLLKATPGDLKVLTLALRAYQPSGNEEMLFTLRAALADQYFRSGQKDQARRFYVELLGSDPSNDLFRQRLAQIDGVDVGEIELDQPVLMEDSTVGPPSGSAPAVDATPPPAAAVAAGHGASFEPNERFAEANVFAKYGLAEKAINHLREIIKYFPEHFEARERLVTLLIEQGRAAEAEPLARPVAAAYRERGDTESLRALTEAIPSVAEPSGAKVAVAGAAGAEDEDEVILIDVEGDELAGWKDFEEEAPEPAVAEASAAEREFEIVDVEGADSPPETESTFGESSVPASFFEDGEGAEPDALDLPVTVDFDEMALAPSADVPDASSGAFAALDELERSILGPRRGEQPPDAEVPSPADGQRPAIAMSGKPLAGRSEVPVVPPEPTEPEPEPLEVPIQEELVEIDGLAGPAIDDLEQIDFFIAQELYEDALRLLGRLEGEYPGDPEVADRRMALKAKGVLLEEVSGIHEAPEELFAEEEEYIDLARELEQELAEEEAMVDEATGRGKDEALLEEVFREFQKGVAEQLSEEDSDTHFNLGIAYKEMGLIPEAIREFQIASRDPGYFVEGCSMIGVCYIEQGIASSAVEWFERALQAPNLESEPRMALRYDLASALEIAGDVGRACSVLEEIEAERPGFRDVQERLSNLSQQRRAN